MKVFLLLSTLLVGASSFVVVPASGRRHTALAALIPVEDMTPDQLEMNKIADKWAEIRLLSREEAETQLDGEWLEAYKRFYTKYDEDMTKLMEISTLLKKAIDRPRIEKKSKSQRKRDKWAKVQAREAARAGN